MGTPVRGRTIGTLAIVAALLLGACGGEGAAPATGSREVTFESSDGVALGGRLFGPDDAPAGIVLAHMSPSDQSSWFDFAERLGREGYRVLTFNFRGYCPGGEAGCSEGERSVPAIWQDVEGAIGELRGRGARRIGLVGASMGGTASLVAASKEGADVDAIVTLSAPAEVEGLDANGEVLSQVPGAKLFIAGHEDAAAAAAVDILYAQSLQPKRPVILTTGDHGTDILTGNQAGIASTEIIGWLERYVAVDG
ncbi:MAG TPA: alpha/beta fold hydrolase [Actinomycetota bacterium]|nr:alpha/beta fold hydrolase [Actinomycetota bacterium]